jgi:hypothetical protein
LIFSGKSKKKVLGTGDIVVKWSSLGKPHSVCVSVAASLSKFQNEKHTQNQNETLRVTKRSRVNVQRISGADNSPQSSVSSPQKCKSPVSGAFAMFNPSAMNKLPLVF